MPHPPVIAWEITDILPESWNDILKETYKDVISDPVSWAQHVVEEFGATLICLHLSSGSPEFDERDVSRIVETVTSVLASVKVPLIIRGSRPSENQSILLSKCAEAAAGERCLISSADAEHYKTVVASCAAYGHGLVAESPIDLNMAKQLNILIQEMNFPLDRVVMDPLTGGLGYGLEYTYSVMERIRIQALGGDNLMQIPMICFVGEEAWRVKETKVDESEKPLWGERRERGILWEILTAVPLLLAGADILVMRHPQAIAEVKNTIEWLMKMGE
jgi:acetyl-CoA decarbonylase/synthase complex subunit delta